MNNSKLEEYMIEGKPTSEYNRDWKCPVCGTRFDRDKHTISVFKPKDKETHGGFIPKENCIEVHCECGYHYWFHKDFEEEHAWQYELASCTNCHYFEGVDDDDYGKCGTDSMKLIAIENPDAKPQCPLGRYYSVGEEDG